MKTSRLAATANPCGATHPCASASTRSAQSGRSLSHLAAILWLALIGQTVTAASVNIAWNPNPESNISGYKLSYGTSTGSYSNTLSIGTATTTSVSGLNEGQTYYFVVKAVNTTGLESAPSAEVSHTVPLPPPPPPLVGGMRVMDRSEWTVTVSSELGGSLVKSSAIDGRNDTYWHSQRSGAPVPHWIAVNLGSRQFIKGFRCLPRLPEQNPDNRALLRDWEMYVSDDGVQWGQPVATGQFPWDHALKEFQLSSPVAGGHVKIQMVTAWGEAAPYAFQVAELNLLVMDEATNTPPQNQAPIALAAAVGTNEDSAVAITLTGSDPEGSPLSYRIVSGPAKGTLSGIAPNLTYAPNSNANGSDSFTFVANDGMADSNTATVSITVTPVNDVPVAAAKVISATAGSPVGIVLSASDADGDPLTFSIVSSPAQGSLSGTPPNLTYTPNANASGSDSFSFRASDGKVNSNTAAISINISSVNSAPVAAGQSVSTNEDQPLSIRLSATDANSDPLTYRILSQPSMGTLSGTVPNLTYTPTANANGSDSFTFVANDGKADSNTATVSIIITPVNDAPVAVAQVTSTLADKALGIFLTASDQDGDPLTFSIVGGPTQGSLSGIAPNLTYTPSASASGSDSFSFRASDGKANSNTATVSITIIAVIDQLFISPVADLNVIKGGSVGPIAFTVGDVETSANNLSVSATSSNTTVLPASGITLGGFGSDRAITLTPAAGQTGAATVTLQVSNGKLTKSTTFTLTVQEVVADPTLHLGLPFDELSGDTASDVSSGARHATLVGGVLHTHDGRHGRALDFATAGAMVQLGALDIPGSAMTLAAWVRADSFAINDARILSKASGVNEQDHHWMLSTISSSGIKPRLRLKTANGGTATLIGTTTLTTGVWTHLAATYDGTTMRLFVNGQPAGTLAKTGAISQNASVAAAIGDQPQGTRGFDGLIDEVRLYTRALPQTELFQIMEEPLVLPEPENTAPTISAINDQVIPENGTAGPITINVGDAESSAADLVINVTSSDTALLTEAGMILGGSGAERSLSLTPVPNQSGASLVTVTVSDGFLSATSQFTITISPVNQAPVAAGQLIAATAGTPVGIVLSASDANGDPLTFSIVGSPTQGSLSGNPPNLTYTPNASASGSDSFSFRASDGKAISNTATVSITIKAPVNAENKAPVFQTDLITAASGKIDEAYVTESLAGSATDPDGEVVSFSKAAGPEWLVVSPDGRISGTPPAGSEGLNSFTIRATDSKSAFDEAVLQITIEAAMLPLPWSLARIGTVSEQAAAWGEASVLNIKSPGSLAGSADSGLFTWQTLSGDGEIIAKISTLENASSLSLIGLEIRESLAQNSKHVFIGTDGNGSLRFIRRSKNGSSTSLSNVGTGMPPNLWLRLVRSGSTVSAFSSVDGSSWKRIGRTTVSPSGSSYIGMMVCGGGDNLSTGVFQDVTVKP